MAKLIDLRLNETIYWLTVVATIFLPLTFVTGFFGMNFGWMVDRIDTFSRLPARSASEAPWPARLRLHPGAPPRHPGRARSGKAARPLGRYIRSYPETRYLRRRGR